MASKTEKKSKNYKIIRQHTHSTQISSPAFPHPLQILFNLWVCWIPHEAPAASIQTPLRWLRSPPSHGRTAIFRHGRNTAVDKTVSRAGLCVMDGLSRTGSHVRHGHGTAADKTVSRACLCGTDGLSQTPTVRHGRGTSVDKTVSRAGLCVTDGLSRTGSHASTAPSRARQELFLKPPLSW